MNAKTVVVCLMFDCMGAPYKLAFDNEQYAEDFADNHGFDIDFLDHMTLEEAEKRGYEY